MAMLTGVVVTEALAFSITPFAVLVLGGRGRLMAAVSQVHLPPELGLPGRLATRTAPLPSRAQGIP